MDGYANLFGRCRQTKVKLQYQIFGIKSENASPRDSLGLLTMKKKMRNGKGFGTQTLGGFFESFGAQNEQHLPLTW